MVAQTVSSDMETGFVGEDEKPIAEYLEPAPSNLKNVISPLLHMS